MVKVDPRSYHDQGFLLFRNFFDKQEIQNILHECRQVFGKQMQRLGILPESGLNVDAASEEFHHAMVEFFNRDFDSFTYCGKQVQHLISLHRLSLDERIINVLHELGISFPNISTRPVLFFNSEQLAKKEVYWKVGAHQDWRSMQGSLDSMIVWLPLVDIDHELGALEVVPGTHRRGLLTDRVEDGFGMVSGFTDDDFVSVPVTTGDALFFSSFLVHRSGNNSTNRIRWSTHFRYNNLDEKTFIDRGYPHSYIYKPQDQLITPNFPTATEVQEALRNQTAVSAKTAVTR